MTNLKQLTLEQKASLLAGGGFWSTTAIPEAGVEALVLTDGPHGVRRQKHGTDHLGIYHSEPATCFPPAVAVGSSWNKEVAARIGEALALEARALGVNVLLGPGVNIKRSPLGGRNFEYFSEDPYLSGVLGVAYVRALQAGGVGASLKHYAANDQETERMVISADMDERTLREIHLSAFERVIKEANPATVMCSYNKVNGVQASENRWLLTDVLRTEWGYPGVVISDWGAVRSPVKSLAAGLDLSMPGTGEQATDLILAAVRSGELDESVIDSSAQRLLDLGAYAGNEATSYDVQGHHLLARQLATECAVLLKNDNQVLPLDAGSSILVVGEFASMPRYQGGGSSHVHSTRVDVALDCISDIVAAGGGTVHFARGFDSSRPDDSLHTAAVAAAKEADFTVIFAGNAETEESEGFDRDGIELSPDQIRLIREVAAASAKTVVVLSNGGVVSLEDWHDEVDAILEGFLLGQGGGHALADLIFGRENPSGKLAESIPLRLQDTPTYLAFPGEQGHVRYSEGVMVGYRHYETVGASVRYPFGHGLSYTNFDHTQLKVDATGRDAVSVRVTVKNAGDKQGQHVVQAYVSTSAGPVLRPARALAAFAKVQLQPDEETTVELEIDRRVLAYWDIALQRWVVAPGEYTIQINENASTVLLQETVHLDGDHVAPVLSLQSNVAEWLQHPHAGPALRKRMSKVTGQDLSEETDKTKMIASMPMVQILGMVGGAIDSEWLISLLAGPAPSNSRA